MKTLQELSEKLNGKLWSKNGLERLYVNKGYNTKKMKTTTYVEIKDEEFVVKCYVECESQPFEWCKSQAQIVKENLEEDIAEILKENTETEIEIKTEIETEIEIEIEIETEIETENETDNLFKEFIIYKKRDGQSFKEIGSIYCETFKQAKIEFANTCYDDLLNGKHGDNFTDKEDGIYYNGQLFFPKIDLETGIETFYEDVYTWEIRDVN